jgi:DNA-binding NarL/FixJ family response regulator
VIADDHAVVRQGLRAVLGAEPDLVVVGEAGDGLEAGALVERLQPDLLIADVMMPGLTGLELTRQVRQRFPDTRVLIVSMYANEAFVIEALRHGASGYVLKEAGPVELLQAVRAVVGGRRYLSPPISERAIEAYIRRAAPGPLDPYATLTGREREVFALAAEGNSNPEIAARLSIGTRTVETHRARLMRKLGLHNQSELIRYAIQRGILRIEPGPAGGGPAQPASPITGAR